MLVELKKAGVWFDTKELMIYQVNDEGMINPNKPHHLGDDMETDDFLCSLEEDERMIVAVAEINY